MRRSLVIAGIVLLGLLVFFRFARLEQLYG